MHDGHGFVEGLGVRCSGLLAQAIRSQLRRALRLVSRFAAVLIFLPICAVTDDRGPKGDSEDLTRAVVKRLRIGLSLYFWLVLDSAPRARQACQGQQGRTTTEHQVSTNRAPCCFLLCPTQLSPYLPLQERYLLWLQRFKGAVLPGLCWKWVAERPFWPRSCTTKQPVGPY